MSNYNIEYARKGLCPYCGKNKPEEGTQKCLVCLEKNRAAIRRCRDKKLKNGLCVYCGKNKSENDTKGCQSCNRKHREKIAEVKSVEPSKIKKYQDKANANRRTYRAENNLCASCGKRPPANNKKRCSSCLAYHSNATKLYLRRHPDARKRYHAKIRLEAISKYGDTCECCGEHRIEFLVIDHKYNDGNIERERRTGKNQGSTTQWYMYLRREPRREDLQVLCHNCNMAKAFYGVCPHEAERTKINEINSSTGS